MVTTCARCVKPRVSRTSDSASGMNRTNPWNRSSSSPWPSGIIVLVNWSRNRLPPRDNAVNTFTGTTTIVTQWNLNPGQTNSVNLIAFFSNPLIAMSGGAVQIPSSRILGRMATGLPVAFTAFTQNGIGAVGTAGGSLRLFSVNITGANKNSSRTDNLDLQLNLVGFPTLPPGTYSGTLNIRAITQ